MPVVKDKKKLVAFDLYINAGVSQKEIAQRLGIREQTISAWRKKEKWDELKAARSTTREEVIGMWYLQLITVQEAFNELGADEKMKQLGAYAQAVTQITNNITKLERDRATLSHTFQTFKEFLEWLVRKDKSQAQLFSALSHEFYLEKVDRYA